MKETKQLERLSREKRLLLTQTEELRLERLVLAMAEKLQTSVKMSHLLRATVAVLLHAESDLLRECAAAPALKRPDNSSANQLLAFEGSLAEIIHRALSRAPLYVEMRVEPQTAGGSPSESVTQ
jgi:hypothetical protein